MVADFPDFGTPVTAGRFILGGQGHKDVAVSGTAVAIAASQVVQQVMVKADTGNLGIIYLGTATVTNNETAATGGLQLSAGDIVVFPVDNLANVYINGAAADGVSFMWWS